MDKRQPIRLSPISPRMPLVSLHLPVNAIISVLATQSLTLSCSLFTLNSDRHADTRVVDERRANRELRRANRELRTHDERAYEIARNRELLMLRSGQARLRAVPKTTMISPILLICGCAGASRQILCSGQFIRLSLSCLVSAIV